MHLSCRNGLVSYAMQEPLARKLTGSAPFLGRLGRQNIAADRRVDGDAKMTPEPI
jgi:hypothetical protein